MTSSALPAWDAWRRLRRLDVDLARELEARCSLSLPDYDVLTAVATWTGECVRVGALADAMAWSRSRLSRQLSRMERRGLVGREPCERDGRGDDVVLTDAGLRAHERARPVHDGWVRTHVEQPLTRQDRETLARLAHLLVAD